MKSRKSKINALLKFDAQFELPIIGIDEAGRGPGAGDVFAAAVHFPQISKELKKSLKQLDDSKKLTPSLREELYEVITANAIWCSATASIEEIEKINILQASLLAMQRAASQVQTVLAKEPLCLIDGNKIIKNWQVPQKTIVKGDSLSLSIAAASIIAKVERDRYMQNLAQLHPEYGWDSNKGYLTKAHIAAIEKFGVTPFHRPCFLRKIFARQLSLNIS